MPCRRGYKLKLSGYFSLLLLWKSNISIEGNIDRIVMNLSAYNAGSQKQRKSHCT